MKLRDVAHRLEVHHHRHACACRWRGSRAPAPRRRPPRLPATPPARSRCTVPAAQSRIAPFEHARLRHQRDVAVRRQRAHATGVQAAPRTHEAHRARPEQPDAGTRAIARELAAHVGRSRSGRTPARRARTQPAAACDARRSPLRGADRDQRQVETRSAQAVGTFGAAASRAARLRGCSTDRGRPGRRARASAITTIARRSNAGSTSQRDRRVRHRTASARARAGVLHRPRARAHQSMPTSARTCSSTQRASAGRW